MIRNAGEFGEMVRKARTRAGMTQRELAMIANVGERFIVDLEKGKGTSQLDKALTVADRIGVSFIAFDSEATLREKETKKSESLQNKKNSKVISSFRQSRIRKF
ncbi:helix-turn-helix domain-containing protein [Acetobacter malorum]|uniref:helix-turn-helix domain-containing protein n=1 Tax=Acetobacter malorum TaxID=178901 RepID=UPI0009EDF189|nr:helix-turn-helix domain-containing protein [Acetobacter malorum]